MSVRITLADLRSEAVIRLIADHMRLMNELSPPGSNHGFDLQALKADDVSVWAAHIGTELVGCVAIKQIDQRHGEIKWMHTRRGYRNRGIARQILQYTIHIAEDRGYSRLSIETGSQPGFKPAWRVYERHGFSYCGPFADYEDNPPSVFMTMEISPPSPAPPKQAKADI